MFWQNRSQNWWNMRASKVAPSVYWAFPSWLCRFWIYRPLETCEHLWTLCTKKADRNAANMLRTSFFPDAKRPNDRPRSSEVRPLIDLLMTGVRLPSASDSLTRALIGAITPTAPPGSAGWHMERWKGPKWGFLTEDERLWPWQSRVQCEYCELVCKNYLKKKKKTDCLNMFELFDTNWSAHGLGSFLAVNKAPVLISAAPILGLACGGLSPSERKQQLHFKMRNTKETLKPLGTRHWWNMIK